MSQSVTIEPAATTDLSLVALGGVTTLAVFAHHSGEIGDPFDPVVLAGAGLTVALEMVQQQTLVTLQQQTPQVSVEVISGPPGPAGPAADDGPPSPVFTYTGGLLTRVDYADGAVRLLTYNGADQLLRSDLTRAGETRRQDFTWNPDGSLASRLDSVI